MGSVMDSEGVEPVPPGTASYLHTGLEIILHKQESLYHLV